MSEFIFSEEDKETLQRAIEHVEFSRDRLPEKFHFYQNAFNKKLVHILLKSQKKENDDK